MSTFGERLQQALAISGKTRRELAAAVGVSAQAIGQVISGDTVAMSAENSAKAARFLRVDAYWLSTGRGQAVAQGGLSPYAESLALAFDQLTPPHLRESTRAQLLAMLELIATAHQRP